MAVQQDEYLQDQELQPGDLGTAPAKTAAPAAAPASWQAGYETLLQQMGAIQGRADVYKNASPLSADRHMQNIAKTLARDYGIASIGDIGIRYETRPAYVLGSDESAVTIPEEQLPVYYNKKDPNKIIPGYKFASENEGDGYSEYNLQPVSDGKGGTIALPVQQYSKSGMGALAQDLGPIIPVVNLALMAHGVPPLAVAAGNVAFQAGAGNIKDFGDVLRVGAPIMAADPGIVGGAAKLYSAYQAFDSGNVVSGLAFLASAGGLNETALGLRLIDAVKTGNVPGALMTLGQMQGVGDYQFKGDDGKPLVGSDGKPVTLSTFKVGGENGVTLPELAKAATIATTLMSDNPNYGLAVQLAGDLAKSPDTVMAGRAASLVQQLSSPNPNPTALYNAALGFAQTTNAKAPGSAPIDNKTANAAVNSATPRYNDSDLGINPAQQTTTNLAFGDTGDAGANAILSASNAVGQNLTGINDGLTVADLGTRTDAGADTRVRPTLTPKQEQQLEDHGVYWDEEGNSYDEFGNRKNVRIDTRGVSNSESTGGDFEATSSPKTRSLNSFSVDDFADDNDVLLSDLGAFGEDKTISQLTPEQIRLLTTANNNDVLLSDLGVSTTTPITGGTTTGSADTKATTSTDTKGGTTTPAVMPTESQLDSMDAARGATGDLIYTDRSGNSYYVDDDGDVQSLSKEQANTLLTTVTAEDTGRSLDRVVVSGKYEDPGLDYPWQDTGTKTTSSLTTLPTDKITTLPTDKITTLPTDKITTLPTDKITTLPTDKITTLPTDKITTLPTDKITTLPTDKVTTLSSNQISALTTTPARGLQALPTSDARYWRQTGATGTGGQGGVRFFDWYDTPENRTMAPSTMATQNIPAITSEQAGAIAAPRPKQYYNAQTNRYYTDSTGTWQPPAGWVQTNLKGGGKVKTNFYDGGYADFDSPIELRGIGYDGGSMPDEDVYSYLRSLPADNSWASSPSDYGFDALGDSVGYDWAYGDESAREEDVNSYLRGLPSDNASYGGGKDQTARYEKEIKDAAITGSPTKSSSASNVFKQLSDAAKKNPDLMKMLLAAGLGGLIGYAGRSKGMNPLGMQGGSLGLSQGQVYGALKGKPVQRAMGGEIDGYARGGGLHYLKSAEDGMADKIPATIDNKQPAKLSGGEFVIPADVVSHLGNGNSEAGAKQLYSMMDRIRHARTGNKKQGKQINPAKFTPK